ncbi:RNA polymerase sigma factor [Senegalimassilia anaerobia]|uniref:RNA polymerase sigma factor n=1 Tax=Senegalimassilia anaerobia TaxID=1473216 RepID=UPI0023F383BF|nr:sigma factor-like helix-turn-helix DNA-binding protein [Senegalimassilia anaerobia]
MTRFYDSRYEEAATGLSVVISFKHPHLGIIEITIDEGLLEVINELQREYWRLERRESRHSVHLESIPDIYLPHERDTKTPEQVLIERFEDDRINKALCQIPEIQRRRFLLRYLLECSIKDIAELEGVTTRAVKYSIALAKKNLRQILEES